MDFCSGSDQLMNLSFAGCGFRGVYHLGVATCLTSHAPQFLKNITAFAGALAGSLVAAVLATSAPLGRLFISVTSLKERKNVIISEFESKED
ncbi:unnamed protein product [Porites lobata]|uniref:PNPLA domain-containing protein n=1 Tax=Porites lobata TaxID=104759 RepID=A0ABN8NGJ7_9CNID|nr:unnamed protein product [Porites lobata]